MADPTTSNVLLAVPTHASDTDAWDVPVNGDFTALDGMLGGQQTLALSSATTITLSMPATGTVSAVAGPNQSQNACIKLSGTLTGNAVIKVTMPKKYKFDTTLLNVATSYVQISPVSGGGNSVGLPPGELTEVWFDGTNVSLCGLGRTGSFIDMAVSTTQAWMSACSVMPYLPCDGATYNVANYTALGNMLGSTWGGNGVTTFAVPDTRNRLALPVDLSGQGRVTSAGSGVDGTSIAATGGSQYMQSHTHTATVSPNPHSHTIGIQLQSIYQVGGASNGMNAGGSSSTDNTTLTVTNATNGTGASQNMPPVVVFGCKFIKT